VTANEKARTLDSLIDAYLRERRQRHEITPLTVRNLRSILNRFAKSFGARQVKVLGQRDVERWLEGRAGRKSPATRRSELSCVKAFCQWLVRRGYVRKDPTAEIPSVKVFRYLPRALSPEKVAKLLATAPDRRAVLICLLMVQEGLRCGEVAALQVGDIDFLDRTARTVGKGGHERFLPLSDETWRAIQEYLRERPATSGPLIRRTYRREWEGLGGTRSPGWSQSG
jgi:integrase/recombinase XerC